MATLDIPNSDNATIQQDDPHRGGLVIFLHHGPPVSTHQRNTNTRQHERCHLKLVIRARVVPPQTSRPVHAEFSVALLS